MDGVLQVQLSQNQGAPGQSIRAQVRCDAEGVSQVRLMVDEAGGDLDWSLRHEGDVWVADASVPYDAPSGTYQLSFRAYASGGRLVDSAHVPFTVL